MQKAYHWRIFTPANNQTIWPLQWWIIAPAFSPEIIRLAVMMYVRFPLLLRQAEDLLYERGIDISYETVRAWWNRLAALAEWRQISA